MAAVKGMLRLSPPGQGWRESGCGGGWNCGGGGWNCGADDWNCGAGGWNCGAGGCSGSPGIPGPAFCRQVEKPP